MEGNNYLIIAAAFIILTFVVTYNYTTGGLSTTIAVIEIAILIMGIIGSIRMYYQKNGERQI